jgi:hypothetical protein
MSDDIITQYNDDRIGPEYRVLRFWESGFEVAQTWFHEEWDGSYIQLCLARDIANAIEDEVKCRER